MLSQDAHRMERLTTLEYRQFLYYVTGELEQCPKNEIKLSLLCFSHFSSLYFANIFSLSLVTCELHSFYTLSHVSGLL